jgi:hypothetical protein
MSSKKIDTILNLIEIADNNLRTAQKILLEMTDGSVGTTAPSSFSPAPARTWQDSTALEVEEGYFDGENMIGDNGKTYPVPQNYASKTQLIVGDRMKWIQTADREIFKLIQPAERERVVGTFSIEGGNYVVLVDDLSHPVKILKASATYAMKNLGLEVGNDVAIFIPTTTTPTWGAFSSVVTGNEDEEFDNSRSHAPVEKLDDLNEYRDDVVKSEEDYF